MHSIELTNCAMHTLRSCAVTSCTIWQVRHCIVHFGRHINSAFFIFRPSRSDDEVPLPELIPDTKVSHAPPCEGGRGEGYWEGQREGGILGGTKGGREGRRGEGGGREGGGDGRREGGRGGMKEKGKKRASYNYTCRVSRSVIELVLKRRGQ